MFECENGVTLARLYADGRCDPHWTVCWWTVWP